MFFLNYLKSKTLKNVGKDCESITKILITLESTYKKHNENNIASKILAIGNPEVLYLRIITKYSSDRKRLGRAMRSLVISNNIIKEILKMNNMWSTLVSLGRQSDEDFDNLIEFYNKSFPMLEQAKLDIDNLLK